MSDAENRVTVVARDAAVVQTVSSAASATQMALRQFDSLATWLAAIASDPVQPPDPNAPHWIDCLVCQAELPAAGPSGELGQVMDVRAGLPVIVLADQPTIAGAVAAMQAGAQVVFPLPIAVAELRTALIDARDRALVLRPALAEATIANHRLATLDDSEQAVLEHLLAGLANKEVANREGIGLRTAELRRARILKKMNARSLPELVRLVCAARGVVLPGHDEPFRQQ